MNIAIFEFRFFICSHDSVMVMIVQNYNCMRPPTRCETIMCNSDKTVKASYRSHSSGIIILTSSKSQSQYLVIKYSCHRGKVRILLWNIFMTISANSVTTTYPVSLNELTWSISIHRQSTAPLNPDPPKEVGICTYRHLSCKKQALLAHICSRAGIVFALHRLR